MRSQSVVPLLRQLEARGQSGAALLEALKLPKELPTTLDAELEISTLRTLAETAAERAGDEELGVHAAETLEKGRYGLLEYAALSAPTLEHALRQLVRFSALINRAVIYEVERGPREGRISQRVKGKPGALGRQLDDFNLVALLQMGRGMLRQRWVPTKVWLAHPKPAAYPELQRVVGDAPIVFGAESSGFSISPSLLDAPLPGADPTLRALLDAHATAQLKALPPQQSFVDLAASDLEQRLRLGDVPRLGSLAKAMHLSPRTLQRRLEAEGTDFKALLDTVRETMARRLLASGQGQVSELAFILGYGDVSAFVRAFKRWTGLPPGEYARQMAPEAHGRGTRGQATRKAGR
jgi:AraC-like DNA-binding protein